MTTQWRNIEMPLGGVDQFTNAPHVLPGKLRALENGRFFKPPGISKRYGSLGLSQNVLGTAEVLASTKRLVGHGKETHLFDERRMFSYDWDANEWVFRGYVSPCHIERQSIWSEIQTYNDWDIATNQGITVFVRGGSGSGQVGQVVLDGTTETVLSTGDPLADYAGARPRLVSVGNYIYAVWVASNNNIQYSRIDVTSGSYTFPASAGFTGVSTAATTLQLDVCEGFGDSIVIGYKDLATGRATFHRITISNHTSANSFQSLSTPTETIAVHARTGEGVTCVFDDGAGQLIVQTRTSTLLAQAGPANLGNATTATLASIAYMDADQRVVAWKEAANSPNHPHTRAQQVTFSTCALTATGDTLAVRPASKLFNTGGRVYGWVCYESLAALSSGTASIDEALPAGGDQETYYLIEYSDISAAGARTFSTLARWMATACRGIADATSGVNFLPNAVESASSVWDTALLMKTKFEFAGMDPDSETDIDILVGRASLVRIRADFATTNLHQVRQWGEGLAIAGGRPGWYDKRRCYELGFAWKPGNIDFRRDNGVSAAPVVQLVGACYEIVDALGNAHRSAPSEIMELIQSSVTSIDVDTSETLLTAQASFGTAVSPRLIPYRSINDGTELYRAESAPAAGIPATQGQSFQVHNAAAENDTAIQLFDLLYTTGDILDNAGLPPCKHMEVYQNRLWLGGLEDPNSIWFSQPYANFEGPRFNEQLALRVNFAVSALANLETQLVVFGEDDIQLVVGSGPPATGGLDIGFRIIDVPSDVGCINPHSVVVYRDGVIFESRKGIYRLGRGMEVTHVGLAAKGLFETYPTITGAAVVPDRSEVVFTVTNTAGTASRRIVWNYELDAWSRDRLNSGAGFKPTSTAVIWDNDNNRYALATSMDGGLVTVEKVSEYGEANGGTAPPILISFTTPWVKLSTLQDWIRVKGVSILGKFVGAHGVQVQVEYDYVESVIETHTFTQAEIAALAEEQLYIDFGQQVCKSVRITFNEVATIDATPTAGPEIWSLVFEGGFEGTGRFRVPDAGRK